MNNSVINRYQGQLQEMLGEATSVGIIVGETQTPDTMGAALGLYLVLSQNGKNAQIVSKKDPIVELSNLFGIDRVTKSFNGQTKVLTISVPYHEGEIEKVSYNIEQDKLNVNLFAEENGITFSESDVEYIRKGSSPSLIITIGVADESEISNLVDLKSVKIISLDRNPMNSFAGDITISDPSFSSVSEIAASIIRALSFNGDPDAFQNLMDGVTYATRNFTNPATSAAAFESAGFLLANGARRKEKVVSENRQNRTDDRFPDKDQFLNRRPRPRLNPNQNNRFQNQPNPQNQNQIQRQNQMPRQNQAEAPGMVEEMSGRQDEFRQNPVNNQGFDNNSNVQNMSSNVVPSVAPVEDVAPEEVPDDWFLPKVFKGSKKGHQN